MFCNLQIYNFAPDKQNSTGVYCGSSTPRSITILKKAASDYPEAAFIERNYLTMELCRRSVDPFELGDRFQSGNAEIFLNRPV